MQVKILELMETSGVKFGTSGARGLADAMTDMVCYSYTLAFLNYLEKEEGLQKGAEVGIAGDFRPSTDRIMAAAGKAAADAGYKPVNFGKIPSPALALYGMQKKVPVVMVTGSHIPDDRNGMKFNTANGEITKKDELGMKEQTIEFSDDLFHTNGSLNTPFELGEFNDIAEKNYVARYKDYFPENCLQGKTIAIYEHSTVGRKLLGEILEELGAKIIRLGYSDTFIPVDTEAIRPEDQTLASDWAGEYDFDAIVSADGDCDRPLIGDEQGNWLRGDVLGILVAAYLQADAVATPVSCNSALEKSEFFSWIKRTRIGSPFVIAGMEEAKAAGYKKICGYEANGGFLTASDWSRDDQTLEQLPTRDAMLPIIAIVMLSIEKGKVVSELANDLPPRFTASNRLKDFPTEMSNEKIGTMNTSDFEKDKVSVASCFGDLVPELKSIDDTDGARFTFANEDVIHLRPSGNAPELRCYTESSTEEQALSLNEKCIALLEGWRE